MQCEKSKHQILSIHCILALGTDILSQPFNFQERYAGPLQRRQRPANHCPTLTHSSMVPPKINLPMNPPAKASPAPLVSTISSFESLAVGYSVIFTDPSFCADATMVGSAP